MAIDDLTNPFDQLTAMENAVTAGPSPAATFGEQAAVATFRPEEVARDDKKGKGVDTPLLLAGISDAFNKIYLGVDSRQQAQLQSRRDTDSALAQEQRRLHAQRTEAEANRKQRSAESTKTIKAADARADKQNANAMNRDDRNFKRNTKAQKDLTDLNLRNDLTKGLYSDAYTLDLELGEEFDDPTVTRDTPELFGRMVAQVGAARQEEKLALKTDKKAADIQRKTLARLAANLRLWGRGKRLANPQIDGQVEPIVMGPSVEAKADQFLIQAEVDLTDRQATLLAEEDFGVLYAENYAENNALELATVDPEFAQMHLAQAEAEGRAAFREAAVNRTADFTDTSSSDPQKVALGLAAMNVLAPNSAQAIVAIKKFGPSVAVTMFPHLFQATSEIKETFSGLPEKTDETFAADR